MKKLNQFFEAIFIIIVILPLLAWEESKPKKGKTDLRAPILFAIGAVVLFYVGETYIFANS